MEDKFNIDQVLQNGMDNFEPKAPDGVWENIAQQLPSAAGAGVSGNSIFHLIQKASVGLKLSVVLGLGLTAALIVYVANPEKEQTAIAVKAPAKETPSLSEVEKPAVIENAKIRLVQSQREIEPTTTVQNAPNNKEPETGTMPIVQNELSQNKELPSQNLSKGKETKTQEKFDQPIQIIRHPKTEKTEENTNSNFEPEYGNAFSPDGDGKNDIWEIKLENPSYFHLKIVDARGQLVFETDQFGQFWNGINQRNGSECEVGSYAFVIDYQVTNSDKIKTKNGFLSLYR